MPIKREDRHLYGKVWKASTRPAILARAGNACECRGTCGRTHADGRCSAPNGKLVAREDDHPERWRTVQGEAFPLGYGAGLLPPIRVVLTVAHLNHQPGDDRPENLAALCQFCHLRLDLEQHQRSARATRDAKVGQLSLGFAGDAPKAGGIDLLPAAPEADKAAAQRRALPSPCQSCGPRWATICADAPTCHRMEKGTGQL